MSITAELAAAAATLRSARFAGAMTATPAVAALIRAREPLAKWLLSWGGIELEEAGPLPEEVQHALAVARAINGGGAGMTSTPKPVDFLAVPLANGGTWTRLDRLTDGRVMCCLCFEFCTRDQLNQVGGRVEDVCQPCARKEAAVAELPGSACRITLDPGWGGTIQVCTRVKGHDGYHRDDRAAGGAQ